MVNYVQLNGRLCRRRILVSLDGEHAEIIPQGAIGYCLIRFCMHLSVSTSAHTMKLYIYSIYTYCINTKYISKYIYIYVHTYKDHAHGCDHISNYV